MKATVLAGTTVVVLFCVGTASAAFFENFESYANTAEMLAPGAWGDDASTNAPATLSNGLGNPGHSMWHPAGKTAKHIIDPMYPSDDAPIVWEGDIWDDGAGNKRATMGLRNNGGGLALTALLEMGRYNSVRNPETGAYVSGYGIRTVFIDGDPADWVTFVENPGVHSGWSHLRATIRATSIVFEIDLGADGVYDAQRLVTTEDTSNIGYNVLRLGGPSDLASIGGGLAFDNVSIAYAVPEPTTLTLLGLGSLFLRRRK
ncbi:MAG: PEP-CTERM sorting domain-containing protein [Phycisphaerae bacterium]|nr:PEP-CTERM sorting domain-containing protein [Phycisphaerae bacterium]